MGLLCLYVARTIMWIVDEDFKIDRIRRKVRDRYIESEREKEIKK